MGALGAFIVGLFSICFRKLKTKKETKTRIIVLLVAAAIVALLDFAVIKEGGIILALFALFFGWRLIADIVRCIMNKFEPTDETEQEDEQNTSKTDENTSSKDNESEEK